MIHPPSRRALRRTTPYNARVIKYVLACSSVAALAVWPAPAHQPSKVRVGYCTGLKNLEAAKAAGFEYVELSATEIASLSDADFAAAAAHIKQVGIPTPTANLFLPGTLKVTGPDVDPDRQMQHVRKALTRLSTLGTEIVVFGSGGARRVPEGFPKEKAFDQLVDFGRRAAREARVNGITIAVEPLRHEETNIINTAAEGLALVKAIDDPNFQLMIDFYHLASEHEDPAIVLTAGDHIRHLHMANPHGRVFPQKWDEYDYAPFFANLKKIGYDKRISVEASTTDLATQGPEAIALLHRAFAN
jgi:D-psicose/D-tagatose/L-ribulose 3-epimerase